MHGRTAKLLSGTAAMLAAVLLWRVAPVAGAGAPAGPAYTQSGDLVMPADYRTWAFLTSNINMGYPSAGAKADASMPTMFGNVFVNPEAYQAFVRTGTWPDKTMMVIENRGSGNTPALTKTARFQTSDIHGYEFHVKDAAHGGWTFYYVKPGSKSGQPFAKNASCYSCHAQNGAVDTTFVQYYPTLLEIAKAKGTYRKTAE